MHVYVYVCIAICTVTWHMCKAHCMMNMCYNYVATHSNVIIHHIKIVTHYKHNQNHFGVE